jgi:hypothetical protein
VRLPALLRPTPSLAEVEAALTAELGRCADGTRHVPNAWTVHLSPRDHGRLATDLPRWSALLSQALVEEHLRLGRTARGLVTVSVASAPDLPPGAFRLAGAVSHDEPAVVRREQFVPARPRLTVAAGETVPVGSPAAAGIDIEVLLPAGRFVIGSSKDADLRLHDSTVSPHHAAIEVPVDGEAVRLTDLGSLNGTTVDGRPVSTVHLRDGSRIELGGTALLFHCDQLDDGGREGGEAE